MMRRLALPYALVGWLAALIGAAGGIVLRVIDPAPMIPDALGAGDLTMLSVAFLGVTFASVGALLVVRRPENAVGWWMVLIGASNALAGLTGAITFSAVAHGPSWAAIAGVAAWLTNLLLMLGSLSLALGFIFPTGRGHTVAWDRFVRAGALALLATLVVLVLIRPGPLQIFASIENPFGFGPDVRTVLGLPASTLIVASAAFLFPVVVLSVVSRYRMSDRIGRQQLKWFVLAQVVSLGGMAAAATGALIGGRPPEVGMVVFGFAGAVVPVAIGIAILRYRLYAIDRIISRTIAYAALTASIGIIFTTVLLALTTLTATVAGGETIAVAASTLAAFALFQPVRGRVQRTVDRRFDRSRYDADVTVRTFAGRLRGDIDIGAVSREIVDTASAAVRPATAGVWLRGRRPVGDR